MGSDEGLFVPPFAPSPFAPASAGRRAGASPTEAELDRAAPNGPQDGRWQARSPTVLTTDGAARAGVWS